jgi:hypothetical protein
MSRKAFTVAVVAATIAWSIGLAALVAPLTVDAASSGSLVRGSLPAVYYVGSDGKRYVFPNEKTYKSWYSDFSGVMTITDAELASMPIGGNVTYRPGVTMLKIQSDPKVYVVDASGTLRGIPSEACAATLYGSAWNTMVHDVSDAFFVNYSLGADLTSGCSFDKAAVTAAASSINVDKGLGSSGTAAGVSAMLSSGNPAGATLPSNAVGVNVLKVDVKNTGSSAATLSSATITRSGAGVAGDFSAVYLYNGSTRLTTGRSINSSTNEAAFSGLNLTIPAGGMVSLWVAADMSGTAGNVNRLSLTSLMVGGNSVSGLPLAGNIFSLSNATVGGITINEGSNPSDPQAGATQALLARFTLAASSSEDLDLKSVALFQSGSISRSNLSNLTLKQAGLTLATVSGLSDKDLAVFSLSSPMYLEKGATRTFEVYGDISGNSRSGDTVRFYVDESTDVQATGRTYGYGAAVTNNWGSGDATLVTVEAGAFTIAFNGPASKDIAQGGSDVEFFNFSVTSQSNVEVRALTLNLTCATIDGDDLDDLKIVDTATNAIIAGPLGVTAAQCDGGVDPIDFTETWTMSAGQTRTFKVTADVDDAANATGTLTVGLDSFGASDVRNLDNSTYLATTDFVPATDVNGNAMTVVAPSLTVNAASTPVSQTYIKGAQNVALGAWTLAAGDAASLEVTSISLLLAENTATGDPQDVVQTLKLWNGSTQLGDTKSPGSGANPTVVFSNLNLSVPAGETLTVSLTGDLGNTIATAAKFVASVSALDVNDADGDDIGETLIDVDEAAPADAFTDANEMDIALAGSMSVEEGAEDSQSEAGLVLGGASNVVLGKVKFTAQNEELKVTKLQFSTTGPTGVSSLSLYDGSTLVGGPVSVSGTTASFTGMSAVVPKDGSKTLTVKGNLNSVGLSGATTGTAVTIELEDDAGTYEFRGTSAGSSTVLDETDDVFNDITLNQKVLVKSKPTVSLVSLPSTALTNTSLVAQRFTVAADASGDVALKRLGFTVSESLTAAGTTITADSSSSIRRVGDGSNLAGSTILEDSNGNTCDGSDTTCTMYVQFTSEETIAAGTSRTYDLRLTIGGTAVSSGDSLTVQLLGDAATQTGYLANGTAVAQVATATLTGTSGTFGVTINGTEVTAAFNTDLDTTADDLATAIDADGTVGPVVNASAAGAVVTITAVTAGTAFTITNGGTTGGDAAVAIAITTPNSAAGLKLDSSDDDTDNGTARSFVWSDISSVPHNATPAAATGSFTSSADWISGFYVKTVPSDSQTLVKN